MTTPAACLARKKVKNYLRKDTIYASKGYYLPENK